MSLLARQSVGEADMRIEGDAEGTAVNDVSAEISRRLGVVAFRKEAGAGALLVGLFSEQLEWSRDEMERRYDDAGYSAGILSGIYNNRRRFRKAGLDIAYVYGNTEGGDAIVGIRLQLWGRTLDVAYDAEPVDATEASEAQAPDPDIAAALRKILANYKTGKWTRFFTELFLKRGSWPESELRDRWEAIGGSHGVREALGKMLVRNDSSAAGPFATHGLTLVSRGVPGARYWDVRLADGKAAVGGADAEIESVITQGDVATISAGEYLETLLAEAEPRVPMAFDDVEAASEYLGKLRDELSEARVDLQRLEDQLAGSVRKAEDAAARPWVVVNAARRMEENGIPTDPEFASADAILQRNMQELVWCRKRLAELQAGVVVEQADRVVAFGLQSNEIGEVASLGAANVEIARIEGKISEVRGQALKVRLQINKLVDGMVVEMVKAREARGSVNPKCLRMAEITGQAIDARIEIRALQKKIAALENVGGEV